MKSEASKMQNPSLVCGHQHVYPVIEANQSKPRTRMSGRCGYENNLFLLNSVAFVSSYDYHLPSYIFLSCSVAVTLFFLAILLFPHSRCLPIASEQ